jgi:Flp pilus assembly protein CpaB
MILIAAVAIGALAAFGLYSYVQGVEEDAKPNPVTVYVLNASVKRGTAFTDAKASIKQKTIPAEFRPDTFVSDLKELENRVAITDLPANSVLVKGMFVSADVATTSFREQLSGDNVAIAMPIDGVRAVGGLLQPGDEVNILVTVGTKEGAATTPPAGGAASTAIDTQASPYTSSARYFYQKVRILAIGNQVRAVAGAPVADASKDGTSNASNTAATSGGSIVFEVPWQAAQRLASVDPGSLYLTLIPETWKPTALAPIDAAELKGLLPGEDASRLTPYGPAGYTAAAGAGKGN